MFVIFIGVCGWLEIIKEQGFGWFYCEKYSFGIGSKFFKGNVFYYE